MWRSPVYMIALALIAAAIAIWLAGCSSNPRDSNDCRFYKFEGSYLKWTDAGKQIWCKRTWNDPGSGFYGK